MTYLGVVLGLILMAVMVYLALDKKSNFPTRVAALIALAVMILTIVICLFLIFTDNTVPFDESVLIVGAVAEEVEDNGNNIWVMILVFLILAIVFTIIVFHSMKEHKKHIQNVSQNSIKISKTFDF